MPRTFWCVPRRRPTRTTTRGARKASSNSSTTRASSPALPPTTALNRTRRSHDRRGGISTKPSQLARDTHSGVPSREYLAGVALEYLVGMGFPQLQRIQVAFGVVILLTRLRVDAAA